MNGRRMGGRQRGAVAIEFAAVFVLFFAVLYGVIGYCVPLLMLQAFNDAAAAGARVAVALNPEADGYQGNVRQAVDRAVRERLAWMPAQWYQACSGDSYLRGFDSVTVTQTVNGEPKDQTYTRVDVCVSYPYARSPIVPILRLPVVGAIPRLPDVLQGEASLLL